MEKLRKEEEEKKQKLETEEEAKKELEKKDNKKTSTGKKTSAKEATSKADDAQNSQAVGGETGEEKPVEDEVDSQGVNDINQLFDNYCADIVKEFDNSPLDDNFNIQLENEEQKMNEDNNILENKIPEENPNVQQSNSSKEIQVQVQEGLNQEEGNMNNITNELEESGVEQMNEHMQKQAE